MAITKLSSGSSFTNLQKYDSFLAGNPSYVPPSFESIATFTATGSEQSFSFTSIPSTYKHLQLRSMYRDTNTTGYQAYLRIDINNDYNNVYNDHWTYGTGASALTSSGSGSSTYVRYAGYNSSDGNANTFGVSIIDILDYASTSKFKTFRCYSGADNNNGIGGLALTSNLYRSTSAITTLSVYRENDAFAAGSTFALYGIKGA